MNTGDETKVFEILVAEDNAADVSLVRRALKQHDIICVLHVMRDGAEAVQWIESRDRDPKASQLDLLLLDMHLPKCDGEEILKCLRSTERYAQTPVIVMTSLNSEEMEETATRHAALEYFPKPLTLDEFMQLGSVVQRVLGRKPRRTEALSPKKPEGSAA